MSKKRRSPRRMCIGRVELLWRLEGREQHENGMILDKSKMGLGIITGKAIQPGSVISLVQGFTTRLVTVRHCTPVKRQFVLGVEYYVPPEDLAAKTGIAGVDTPAQSSAMADNTSDRPGRKAKRIWY